MPYVLFVCVSVCVIGFMTCLTHTCVIWRTHTPRPRCSPWLRSQRIWNKHYRHRVWGKLEAILCMFVSRTTSSKITETLSRDFLLPSFQTVVTNSAWASYTFKCYHTGAGKGTQSARNMTLHLQMGIQWSTPQWFSYCTQIYHRFFCGTYLTLIVEVAILQKSAVL